MSSALAMVLMAGMAVPGNGPDKVSAEVEERLDLSGEWEGTLRSDKRQVCPVIIDDGTSKRCGFPALTTIHRSHAVNARFEVIEARDGKIRAKYCCDLCLGIYRWEANQLVICIRDVEEEPLESLAADGQIVITLHRVKPGK